MVIEKLTTPELSELEHGKGFKRADACPVEWLIEDQPVQYPLSLETMQKRARAIAEGSAGEQIWLVEHPPLYTAGTSAKDTDLLAPARFPVFAAGRGGQYTYHGPGQRVAYTMLDLRQRGRDIRALVHNLEGWVIDTLAAYNIKGERRDGRIGVWVQRLDRGPGAEDKIAAIGVRVSRWVSFHGISLNIAPDLSHYEGIVPCGVTDHGITSFEDLGHVVPMEEVDSALKKAFETRFGPTKQL